MLFEKRPLLSLILLLGALTSICSSCSTVSGNYDHPEYFDRIFLSAEGIRHSPDPAHSIRYLDSAFNTFPTPGIKDRYRKYMFTGKYWDGIDSFKKAQCYYDSALWIIRKHTKDTAFQREQVAAFYAKGYAFFGQDDYQSAIRYYNLGRQIAEKQDDSCLLSTYSFMLGNVSNGQGRFLEAVIYIKQGLMQAGSCELTIDQFRLLSRKLKDLGILYGKADMPDSGIYYLTQASSFVKKYQYRFSEQPGTDKYIESFMSDVYTELGKIYTAKGDTLTGMRILELALELDTAKGNNSYRTPAIYLKLTNIYLAQNDLLKAAAMLDMLQHYLELTPDTQMESDWLKLQIMYTIKAKRIKDITYYTGVYFRLQDSITKNLRNPHAGVYDQYKNFKNEYTLALVTKEARIKNLLLVIVFSISICIFLIAFLLWLNWTKQKKLNIQANVHNKQLQEALSGLQQSQEDNTKLLRIVVHDLRNDIGGITTLVGILVEEPERSKEDQELMRLIETAGRRAIELVDNLLQMQSFTGKAEKKPTDLKKLLRSCVDLLQYKALAKEQHIQLEASSVVAPVDIGSIWRVISNLISNALKFSPRGAHILVTLKRQRGSILMAVQDHGIGIPDALKDKVFDLFTVARRTGTENEQTSGLGLAISRQIVEHHSGRIWFHTSNGKGTTFYVELPDS